MVLNTDTIYIDLSTRHLPYVGFLYISDIDGYAVVQCIQTGKVYEAPIEELEFHSRKPIKPSDKQNDRLYTIPETRNNE